MSKENDSVYKSSMAIITICISAVVGFISSYIMSEIQNKKLEKRFVAVSLQKPVVSDVRLSEFNVPFYSPDRDSMIQYYGYMPDIVHPMYREGSVNHMPYCINTLTYMCDSNTGIRMPAAIFAMRDLETARRLQNIPDDTIKAWMVAKQYDVNFTIKNPGSIPIIIYQVDAYERTTENMPWDSVFEDRTQINYPTGFTKNMTVSMYRFISSTFRIPAQFKLKIFYKNEYDNTSG